MNFLTKLFSFSIFFGMINVSIYAQTPVTNLPSQWPNIVHYDAIEFNAGNRMYIGGRSSEGFISWNAYPQSSNGAARFRYSGVTASQITFPSWGNQMQFRFSGNSSTYGQPVLWSTTMVLTKGGKVGIGTTNPLYRLHVNNGNLALENGDFEVLSGSGTLNFKINEDGKSWARELQVLTGPIPDYVFETEYPLMPINKVKEFIEKEKHLPGIKSAAEYEEIGAVDVGELQIKLLEKVEELTLYIIELKEEIDSINIEIEKSKDK